MVFPNNDYITFTIDKNTSASFTSPTKKPKKIWLDAGGAGVAFRFKINNDDTGILIHMAGGIQKSFKLASTVDSISISTSSDFPFFLSILIEEWGN